MNMTSEHPAQEILDTPIQKDPLPLPDGNRSGGGEAALVIVSLSVAFLIIFVVFVVVFLRCRRNRKIYIPVTPNVDKMQSAAENHSKPGRATQSQSHLSGIFESLVVTGGKEMDEEDDTKSNNRTTSHSEGLDSSPSLNYKANPDDHGSRKNVPSRSNESKHSRSLPSLKHLSAHEEALSYLAIGQAQNSCNNQQNLKPQASSGIFSSLMNNENGFIRSRSFNERITFGLNISRHSLTNKNRINVNALNRCMTTTEPESRSKTKGKENVKTRKQRNVRGSFIKSMRISNLVEFIPSLNIGKRLSNSVSRYRRSIDNSRISSLETSKLSQRSQAPYADANPNSPEAILGRYSDQFVRYSKGRISPSLNSEKLLENFSQNDFPGELTRGHRIDAIQRSKSCIVFITPHTLKPDHIALKTGNALSFDQLEEYSKKFIG